ncbi:SDR family oxidoreductase [Lysobacter firmicutimachus]|uniref:NADP-dependent 3-hydroxy acid dehydrogenase YdfG n=1 Tax=Lysobacter firmicutimachus TaxID=1792846 RepID=A0AAU8MRW6_9GAMM
MPTPLPTVLVTGASSGIGAVYADRFAHRGHDLVLVARDRARLDALAARLRAETGVRVDVLAADLSDPAALATVEARLRDDAAIEVLVNNAGASLAGGFLEQSPERVGQLIALNAVAPARLAAAIAPKLAAAGRGAVVNIGSVVGLAPEFAMAVYGATKAFVLHFSQALQVELGPRGVYVQAVLPAATRTEIWERSGKDVNALQGVMEVDELVDAALLGYDRREPVTIPPLPDEAQWNALEGARRAMLPNFAQSHAAARYRNRG